MRRVLVTMLILVLTLDAALAGALVHRMGWVSW